MIDVCRKADSFLLTLPHPYRIYYLSETNRGGWERCASIGDLLGRNLVAKSQSYTVQSVH
jgi:hypothetical protein